jgi:hypothetical protein
MRRFANRKINSIVYLPETTVRNYRIRFFALTDGGVIASIGSPKGTPYRVDDDEIILKDITWP